MDNYVALLRGINVGGKNLIKMAELKGCFEKNGFSSVLTYIASGNVLFATEDGDRANLVERIEAILAATFKYRASVVLRTQKQMQDIIRRAPKNFGADPVKYRYDVIFLKDSVSAPVAIRSVPVKPGVDQADVGAGVLYFSRLASRAAQSLLPRLVSQPIYQSMTIRNWNTTTKLLQIMQGREIVQ